jgi:hypothetical protein
VRRAHDLGLIARFSLLQAGGEELPGRHVGDGDARAADVVAEDEGAVRDDAHEGRWWGGDRCSGLCSRVSDSEGFRRERGARAAQEHEEAGADQPE